MTVRAPGEECLTQTQIAQREILAQVREKQNPPLVAPAKAAEPGAQSAGSYGSPHSKYLDISV